MAAGDFEASGGHGNGSTAGRHARAARQAVRQLLAAKAAGDARRAARYARLASAAVDRHLAELRARLS